MNPGKGEGVKRKGVKHNIYLSMCMYHSSKAGLKKKIPPQKKRKKKKEDEEEEEEKKRGGGGGKGDSNAIIL